MKPEVLLELLESAAERLTVRVSYEPLQTSVVHGGLCRVKGEYRIIVDKRASAEERVTTLATALAQVTKLTRQDAVTLTLPPKVREVLRLHEPAPARSAASSGASSIASSGASSGASSIASSGASSIASSGASSIASSGAGAGGASGHGAPGGLATGGRTAA